MIPPRHNPPPRPAPHPAQVAAPWPAFMPLDNATLGQMMLDHLAMELQRQQAAGQGGQYRNSDIGGAV